MEALSSADNSLQTRTRSGVRRLPAKNLRIDMTPMVDLGFLLISFFVITTELSKPTAMKLAMPADGKPSGLGESYALTVLLDGGKNSWYYTGSWQDALNENRVLPLREKGKGSLRDIILLQKQRLDKHPGKEGREGLMVLLKAGKGARYHQVVDVLDEMSISQVGKYAVIRITEEELYWMQQSTAAH